MSNNWFEKILKTIQTGQLSFAKQRYDEAMQKGELSTKEEIAIDQEFQFIDLIKNAKSLFHNDNLDEACLIAKKALDLYNPPRDEAVSLYEDICNEKRDVDLESARNQHEPIVLLHWVNVPKKEDEGEDADPLYCVDSEKNYGIISVFDGMGGAGARKYKHKNTGEEHTSAYWASRIVRSSVEKLISERKRGTSPIDHLDTNLHKTITEALNQGIVDFPNANSSVMNKMARKLPTTMALCAYEIKQDYAYFYSYWSGDSRVYLLTPEKMYFLTIDDANTEDGDPFSPANMDLAMNNAISQDREFVVNKSTISLSFSKDKPIILISATDGCFGYFRNPIEFEYLIRQSLEDSKEESDFMENVKKRIIDNIQQDDFSMGAMSIGCETFKELKQAFYETSDSCSSEYFTWRKDCDIKYEQAKKDLIQLEKEIQEKKRYLDSLHQGNEEENLKWYSRYRETIGVVDQSSIKKV